MEQKYKRFEELQTWFEEEEKKIFEELYNDIQQLTTFKIAFSGNSIRSGWKGQIAMLRATINFVNNEGKFDFASDFTIEFDRNELIFNYGCVGHFGKEMVYYIEKTKLMAKLFDKWEELETKYLEKLNNKTFKEYFDLRSEINCYERQKEREEKEKTFNKVLENIKPGQTYFFDQQQELWGVITRITPKRVYYKLYWKNWNGATISGGERFENQSYFVGAIQRNNYTLKED